MSQNEKPVCSCCGSEQVLADAWAEWCSETQKWVLYNTFDNSHCRDCDGECSIDWVPSDSPAISEWEKLARSKGWQAEEGDDQPERNGVVADSWSAACAADNLDEEDFIDDEPATA